MNEGFLALLLAILVSLILAMGMSSVAHAWDHREQQIYDQYMRQQELYNQYMQQQMYIMQQQENARRAQQTRDYWDRVDRQNSYRYNGEFSRPFPPAPFSQGF